MGQSNWIPFYVVQAVLKQSPYSASDLKKYMYFDGWQTISHGREVTLLDEFKNYGEPETHIHQLPGQIELYLNGYYEVYEVAQERGTDSTGEEYPIYVSCLVVNNEFNNHKIGDKKRSHLDAFVTNPADEGLVVDYASVHISPYDSNPHIYCQRSDLETFCEEEGIPNAKLRIAQYSQTPPPPPRPSGYEPNQPPIKEDTIELSQYLELEGELQAAKQEIAKLRSELEEQKHYDPKAQVINPMIKTIRTLSAVLLEEPSLPDDVPIATVRKIFSHIDGIDGAPTTEKTLKKHLTTI